MNLRDVLAAMPPGTLIPAAWLLDQLNGDGVALDPVPDASELLTVAQLATRFHRAPSTVRGWIAAGRFPGAFPLNDKDWRVPPSAVAAFIESQQGKAGSADLGAWRRVKKA